MYKFLHAHTHLFCPLTCACRGEKQRGSFICFKLCDERWALQAVVRIVKPLCVCVCMCLPLSRPCVCVRVCVFLSVGLCVCSWRHSSSGANVGLPTHFSESHRCRFNTTRTRRAPPVGSGMVHACKDRRETIRRCFCVSMCSVWDICRIVSKCKSEVVVLYLSICTWCYLFFVVCI